MPDLADFETLTLSGPADHVLTVTLCRPDARNALDTQMGHDLVHVFEDLALDARDVRCVILTGDGDKAFCAGGDMKERRRMSDEAW